MTVLDCHAYLNTGQNPRSLAVPDWYVYNYELIKLNVLMQYYVPETFKIPQIYLCTSCFIIMSEVFALKLKRHEDYLNEDMT